MKTKQYFVCDKCGTIASNAAMDIEGNDCYYKEIEKFGGSTCDGKYVAMPLDYIPFSSVNEMRKHLRTIKQTDNWLPFYPRWINQLYAYFKGYYWEPCPVCGEKFGGHEWYGALIISHGLLFKEDKEGICPMCALVHYKQTGMYNIEK
jgi:hypothetical protein